MFSLKFKVVNSLLEHKRDINFVLYFKSKAVNRLFLQLSSLSPVKYSTPLRSVIPLFSTLIFFTASNSSCDKASSPFVLKFVFTYSLKFGSGKVSPFIATTPGSAQTGLTIKFITSIIIASSIAMRLSRFFFIIPLLILYGNGFLAFYLYLTKLFSFPHHPKV